MLEIKNLHVEVEDKQILNGIDLNVKAGEMHAIMGLNGSGKSTLSNAITGRENYNITKGDIIYKNQSLLDTEPNERALNGIFMSFNDAPGGLKEELKEITWALGFEYIFAKTLALRSGFFNESEEKGSRKYMTFGAGVKLNGIVIDISYLSSMSKIRNPLENTLRFSLSFNFDGLGLQPLPEEGQASDKGSVSMQ